jgi:hypothetical protein
MLELDYYVMHRIWSHLVLEKLHLPWKWKEDKNPTICHKSKRWIQHPYITMYESLCLRWQLGLMLIEGENVKAKKSYSYVSSDWILPWPRAIIHPSLSLMMWVLNHFVRVQYRYSPSQRTWIRGAQLKSLSRVVVVGKIASKIKISFYLLQLLMRLKCHWPQNCRLAAPTLIQRWSINKIDRPSSPT